MYYDWTREEEGIVVYPPCCFDAIDKILLGEDGNGTGFGICLMMTILLILGMYTYGY